jgi:tetratricopeptide (TPR) repeat protein
VNVWPPLWVSGWGTPGWAWGRNETFVFHNPFVVVPTVSSTTTVVEVPVFLDYSRPLPLPAEEVMAEDFDSGEELAPMDEVTQQAMDYFDKAKAAFRDSDYKAALQTIDSAIELLPSDATLHEFRALCLFAMNDYQQAAATIYAVLAAGPGWNWETMASLYRDTSTHSQQLRTLEAHVRANPDDSAAAFLLAYQYMTMGHIDAAVRKWERVAKLLPEDQLTAQLLEAFRPAVADAAEPAIRE